MRPDFGGGSPGHTVRAVLSSDLSPLVSMPERKARGHLKHTELGITDYEVLIQEAKRVVQSPDRVMVFFGKDGHLQYAFAKSGNDWRIVVIDADTQQIRTFYGPRKDEWVSLEQRIVDGKRSQGWVELVWRSKE